jgi:hypothetical protein
MGRNIFLTDAFCFVPAMSKHEYFNKVDTQNTKIHNFSKHIKNLEVQIFS